MSKKKDKNTTMMLSKFSSPYILVYSRDENINHSKKKDIKDDIL